MFDAENEIDEYDFENELEATANTQWSKSGSVYSPTSETVEALPPGYYKNMMVFGQIRFLKCSMKIKGLLRLNSRNVHEILQDIENFWEKEELFQLYKVPYKRGILLSGPPGTGKTCLIKMLVADMIKRGGVCLEYFDENSLEEALRCLSTMQPETPVLVIIEDIDRMGVSSELLNILDGVINLHNVVFLATTNHPEDLDEALVNRPGRLDAHYKIDPPNKKVREQFIKSILARGDKRDFPINKWVEDTVDLPLGHIKELIVSVVVLGKDYDQALEMMRSMRAGQDDGSQEPDALLKKLDKVVKKASKKNRR